MQKTVLNFQIIIEESNPIENQTMNAPICLDEVFKGKKFHVQEYRKKTEGNFIQSYDQFEYTLIQVDP